MEMAALTIWAPTLLLVAARLIGMLMLAPVFAHRVVPVKLRLAAALVMSLAVVARLDAPVLATSRVSTLLAMLAGEAALGATIALAAAAVFAGVELAALHMSQQMGIALADVYNPSAGQMHGTVRALLGLLAIAIFLLIGGHRALIGSLLRTFELLPPPAAVLGDDLLAMLTGVLAASFALAVKVAAPVLTAMLLATVALGLIQRTLPQMNLLSTHLPVRVLIGLAALAATIGVLDPLLSGAVDSLTERIILLIQARI
jgi:flagellar biosynthetic protein FliR